MGKYFNTQLNLNCSNMERTWLSIDTIPSWFVFGSLRNKRSANHLKNIWVLYGKTLHISSLSVSFPFKFNWSLKTTRGWMQFKANFFLANKGRIRTNLGDNLTCFSKLLLNSSSINIISVFLTVVCGYKKKVGVELGK